MITKQLLLPVVTLALAIVGFAATTSANAREDSDDAPVVFQSTLTRAQVRAEAVRALANGEVPYGEHVYVAPIIGVAKTRGQVVAETREAIRLGLVRHGEVTVFPTSEQLARVEMAGLAALRMNVAAR